VAVKDGAASRFSVRVANPGGHTTLVSECGSERARERWCETHRSVDCVLPLDRVLSSGYEVIRRG
jgi:hypothetical protein